MTDFDRLRQQYRVIRTAIADFIGITGKLQETFEGLKRQLVAKARINQDNELRNWIDSEMKRHNKSLQSMNKAFQDEAEELLTATEDTDDDRKLQLEHRIAIGKILLREMYLRRDYLVGAIDRMRDKLLKQ